METKKYDHMGKFIPNSDQKRPLEDYAILCTRISPSDKDVAVCEAEKEALRIKLIDL